MAMVTPTSFVYKLRNGGLEKTRDFPSSYCKAETELEQNLGLL